MVSGPSFAAWARRVSVALLVVASFAAACSSGSEPSSSPADPPVTGPTTATTVVPSVPPIPDPADAVADGDGQYVWPRHLVAVSAATGETGRTAIAEAIGAIDLEVIVEGSSDSLGLHLLRVADPNDIEQVQADLGGHEDLLAVGALRGHHDVISQDARPADWDDPQWEGIDVSWPFELIGVEELWAAGFVAAPDVGVLIPDFGILDDHPDLGFVEPPTAVFDDPPDDRLIWDISQAAHGTAVASLACGEHNGSGVAGVAGGCRLYGLDMLYSFTAGHEETMTTSLAFAVLINEMLAAKPDIRVVNVSWGFGPNPAGGCDDPATPIDVFALNRLFLNHPDVIFVAAAGNCGLDLPVVESADDFIDQPVQFPAGAAGLVDNVIAVTAVGEDLVVPPFATVGAAVTVAAPGGSSVDGEAIWGAAFDCSEGSCTPSYGSLAGTSLAAPFVSGLLALILQADPTVTPAAIKSCLAETSTPLDGVGLLAVVPAFECATGIDVTPPEGAVYDDRFPGLVGIPADGAVYIDYDPDDEPLPGRCSVRLAAGVERSDEAALYSYNERRSGETYSYLFNETEVFESGQFGSPPSPVPYLLIDSDEPATNYIGYGYSRFLAPGDRADCVERAEQYRASEGIEAFDFMHWVIETPHRPRPDAPSIELSTQWDRAVWNQERCRVIEWWSVPTAWLDEGREVAVEGRPPVPVTSEFFDNALPLDERFDADGFEPYSVPGRAALAAEARTVRDNCAWVEHNQERSISATGGS